jgi:hypothetical protein
MNMPHPVYRRQLIVWAFLLVLIVFGGLFLRHFLTAPAPVPPPLESPRQLRTVTLYFASANGTGLVAEGRDIADCLAEADCLKATVQALIDGPVGDLTPVFPPQALLRGISTNGSEVQVDFDRALVDNHPGGSWGELLTVYALADTIAVNFPHLRQVRILVEGAAVETIKGHVDLRQPVNPDFRLLLSTDGSPPVAAPAERSR